MHQVLDITLAPRNGAFDLALDAPTLVFHPFHELGQYTFAYGCVFDYAAARDVFRPCFELWLEEHDAGGARRDTCGDRGEHFSQRNEGEVRDEKIDRRKFGEVARIDSLEQGDPRVLAQLHVELRPPDVDGDHRGGTALEQAIGESAGRGAKVEAAETGRVYAECVEGGFKLVAATADKAVGFEQFDWCVIVEELRGLHKDGGPNAGAASHDEALGAFPALGEAALNEELVGADAWHRVRLVNRPSSVQDAIYCRAGPMTHAAVSELLYLVDEAFSAPPGGDGDSHSLLANLASVTNDLWGYVPAGGRRSIRDITLHVGSCKHMYRNHAFEDGALTWTSPVVWPWPEGDAPMAASLDWLREAQQLFRAAVARLDDEQLEVARRAPWGELRPTRWLIKVILEHDLYHAGEINHIRSLAMGDDEWAYLK